MDYYGLEFIICLFPISFCKKIIIMVINKELLKMIHIILNCLDNKK